MKSLKHLLLAIALAVTAKADPIMFTYTGHGSGTLDGNAFGDTAFTITAWGDTANRTDNGSAYAIIHDSATIDLGGNVYDFITGTRTFYNHTNNTPGFSRASGADLYNGPFGQSSLLGWDMLSSIGPVSGTTSLLQWANNGGINTSGGILFFNDNYTTSGTFTATVGVPDSGSTLLLIGAALLCLAAARRRSAI